MLSRLDPVRNDQPLVVILGDDTDDEDHDLLFPALRARDTSVIRVHPNELNIRMASGSLQFSVAGERIQPDLVVGWVLEGLLFPGMAHLEAFQAAGVRVINDAITLFRAQNKYVTSAILTASKTQQYPVITGRDPGTLANWMTDVGGSAVVKPLFGYGGRGLRRIRSPEEMEAVMRDIEREDTPYYAMPWVDNPGRDIRVYTVNHHPMFAMYRHAPEGQWITNVRAGGEISMCPLSDEIINLASRASKDAGTLIGGVDIGEDQASGELVVYEVNSCPTCEPPVLDAVADFLAALARDFEAALQTWRPELVYRELNNDPGLFHRSKQGLLRSHD